MVTVPFERGVLEIEVEMLLIPFYICLQTFLLHPSSNELRRALDMNAPATVYFIHICVYNTLTVFVRSIQHKKFRK